MPPVFLLDSSDDEWPSPTSNVSNVAKSSSQTDPEGGPAQRSDKTFGASKTPRDRLQARFEAQAAPPLPQIPQTVQRLFHSGVRSSSPISVTSSQSSEASSEGPFVPFSSSERPRKRKLAHIDFRDEVESELSQRIKCQVLSDAATVPTRLRGVHISPRLFPSSILSQGPGGRLREQGALESLLSIPGVRDGASYGDEKYTSIDLEDFCAYWTPNSLRGRGLDHPELFSLVDLFGRKKEGKVFFDGCARAADQSFRLTRVSFDTLTIGKLEDLDSATVGSDIWISSPTSRRQNTYYRICSTARGYARFHNPFVWVADLIKHSIDFIFHNEEPTTLSDFRETFFKWLLHQHHGDQSFHKWHEAFDCQTDFRSTLAAYYELLEAQVNGLGPEYAGQPLLKEINASYIDPEPLRQTKTIVTSFVHECFKHMWFGHMLQEVKPEAQLDLPAWWQSGFSPHETFTTRSISFLDQPSNLVNIGDVVMVEPDDQNVSNWRQDSEHVWYGYVQDIEEEDGKNFLNLIWLDAPSHTVACGQHYPYPNELFMTDHCECENKIPEGEVMGLAAVKFFASEPSDKTLFVRQCFSRHDSSFETLKAYHLKCACRRMSGELFEAGETILVKQKSSELLEPVMLLEDTCVGHEYLQDKIVLVRPLYRRYMFDGQGLPNELVWTNEIEEIRPSSIDRRCHVRFVVGDDRKRVPSPYNQNGVGNFFFIRTAVINGSFCELDAVPSQAAKMKQGFDPKCSLSEPLKGLDLYCGSGNFGQGIESGGAVRMGYAVDIESLAIHTYRANLDEPEAMKFYLGSVDDALYQAIRGKSKPNVPVIGEIDFICAGSPCQGFSSLNQFKMSDKSLKNVSLIPSVIAYVEVFRPKYAILENVSTITRQEKTSKQMIFPQLLATLVSMGYQVQIFNADACTAGAPQTRSRVFVVAVAPGMPLLSPPGTSHQFVKGQTDRSLGKAPNGLPFGQRDLDGRRAFQSVSVGEALKHLPRVQDGKAPCIPFPFHRPPQDEPWLSRAMIQSVPRGHNKPSLAKALLADFVEPFLVKEYPDYFKKMKKYPDSRAYGRVSSTGAFETIVATFSVQDMFTGRVVHYEEDRLLTLEEAKCAQQFPRNFVLLGSGAKAWRLIGNSVPRGLSLALGLSIREALLKHQKWAESSEDYVDRISSVIPSSSQSSQATILPSRPLALTVSQWLGTPRVHDKDEPLVVEDSQPSSDVPHIFSEHEPWRQRSVTLSRAATPLASSREEPAQRRGPAGNVEDESDDELTFLSARVRGADASIFLDGAPTPCARPSRAKEMGIERAALTDVDGPPTPYTRPSQAKEMDIRTALTDIDALFFEYESDSEVVDAPVARQEAAPKATMTAHPTAVVIDEDEEDKGLFVTPFGSPASGPSGDPIDGQTGEWTGFGDD